ncbi:Coq4 family protein [Nostoc sp. UHCC 0302]|uniref:Coq4 family protein n=1 Tax=Nostoc sp. UHCC 0302 TaxID=3134896 RepID=UPI00311CD368
MLSGKNSNLRLDFLKTLKGAVTLALDPGRADATPDIEDGMIKLKATQLAIDYVKTVPGVVEIVQERYLAPPPDLASLAKLPSGSLGRCFAEYIEKTGFDPNYYRGLPITDDTSYILTRLRQTHDIWHLVTGLGSNVNGELGLQAFCLAQIRIPLPILLIAGGLLRTLFTAPDELGLLLEQIAIGYRLGAKAQPFLAQKWEDNWHKPLAELREELNVVVVDEYVP